MKKYLLKIVDYYIRKQYGQRCIDYYPTCIGCQVWQARDVVFDIPESDGYRIWADEWINELFEDNKNERDMKRLRK